MSDHKLCPTCEKEVSIHFFYKDQCVPCAASKGASAKVKPSTDYESVEDKGCASGACTL